jgi:lipoate-protein ligase A
LAPDPAVRLLIDSLADGAHNMAADEVLLEDAAAGTASLRFYGWCVPTVSLGYFQPHASRPPVLPFVRRPSGGMTLVHHHELTYCLALPAGPAWQSGEPWLRQMHRVIAAALSRFGVVARPHEGPDQHPETTLCFRHFTAGDLILGGAKVAGSAQRKYRRALMQHGGILLARTEFAPELAGIRELTGRRPEPHELTAAIRDSFAEKTGWRLVECDWEEGMRGRVAELVRGKYGRPEWNEKR